MFLTEQLFQNISHFPPHILIVLQLPLTERGLIILNWAKRTSRTARFAITAMHCFSLGYSSTIDRIRPSEFNCVWYKKKLGVSCCILREWWLDGTDAPRSTSKEVNSSSVGSDLSFSPAKLPLVSFRCLDTNWFMCPSSSSSFSLSKPSS